MCFSIENLEDPSMQVLSELRAVTSETVKLAAALGLILIPLYFATLGIELVRGDTSAQVFSIASILKIDWF